MLKRIAPLSLPLLAACLLAACASQSTTSPETDYRAKAHALLKRDFQAKGIAGLERLELDDLQVACNDAGNRPPPDIAEKMQKEQLATVKLPDNGELLGDWKEGEKIAQSGRGFTWTDKPGLPAGGNCYNCHQISPKESSFGTVGPSLFGFGKHRGNGPEVQKYVYSKIYNAKAYNLCSEMPRFGKIGALNEEQIRHLVALLLHPDSPVNK